MSQLFLPSIEEDIMASSIRRQKLLCDRLIRDIEQKGLSQQAAMERLREIETGLKRLCQPV